MNDVNHHYLFSTFPQEIKTFDLKFEKEPGIVAHTSNTALRRLRQVDRDLEGQPGLLSENLSKKQTNKKKTKQIYKRINYKKEKPQIEQIEQSRMNSFIKKQTKIYIM